MSNETEMVKVATLARMFDCDKRTMQEVLYRVRQSHDIPTVKWNGVERVDLRAFKRAVLECATICWQKQ